MITSSNVQVEIRYKRGKKKIRIRRRNSRQKKKKMSTSALQLAFGRKRQMPIDEEGPRESQSTVNMIINPLMRLEPSHWSKHVPQMSTLHPLLANCRAEQSE